MIAGETKLLGGRPLPTKMEMIPAGKKGYSTVLHYLSLEFDQPLEDQFFTTQNMPRIQ